MPNPTFRSMSSAGYFSTGVAIGLLVGVFVGFIAHGIMKQNSAPSVQKVDPSVYDLQDSDVLAPATNPLWDSAETPTPPVQEGPSDEDTRDTPDVTTPSSSPASPDPLIRGQQNLQDWPERSQAEEALHPEDDESPDEARPNPGGGRLAEDPSVSFDAPED